MFCLFVLLNPKEADLVLGGDEGKECTYIKGYMKRQAIFSCLTCTMDGNAGVCTACSLSCHDGHEVFFISSFFSLDMLSSGRGVSLDSFQQLMGMKFAIAPNFIQLQCY